jgi:hypothetical protein
MGDFNGMAEQTVAQSAPEDIAMAEQFHEHLESAHKRVQNLEVELERTRRVARALESALGQLETKTPDSAGPYDVPR